MTPSLLAGRPLTRQIPKGQLCAAKWSQHFVSNSPLADPDYSSACAETLSWLLSLADQPEQALGLLPQGIARALEACFVRVECDGARGSRARKAEFGTLPLCLEAHLGRGRDFAHDTGLASLAELEGNPHGLLCVPLRAWNSPRVVALIVIARTSAPFTRQDASFVSLVSTSLANLLQGIPAPAPRTRLSPDRRATREMIRQPVLPARAAKGGSGNFQVDGTKIDTRIRRKTLFYPEAPNAKPKTVTLTTRVRRAMSERLSGSRPA